jgi:hypothetical protein
MSMLRRGGCSGFLVVLLHWMPTLVSTVRRRESRTVGGD